MTKIYFKSSYLQKKNTENVAVLLATFFFASPLKNRNFPYLKKRSRSFLHKEKVQDKEYEGKLICICNWLKPGPTGIKICEEIFCGSSFLHWRTRPNTFLTTPPPPLCVLPCDNRQNCRVHLCFVSLEPAAIFQYCFLTMAKIMDSLHLSSLTLA
jgi:hypothetical protein